MCPTASVAACLDPVLSSYWCRGTVWNEKPGLPVICGQLHTISSTFTVPWLLAATNTLAPWKYKCDNGKSMWHLYLWSEKHLSHICEKLETEDCVQTGKKPRKYNLQVSMSQHWQTHWNHHLSSPFPAEQGKKNHHIPQNTFVNVWWAD